MKCRTHDNSKTVKHSPNKNIYSKAAEQAWGMANEGERRRSETEKGRTM